MKNLITALKTGGLLPKERVLLIVHNEVARDKTGKEILTEADKYALSEGWTPKNNYEVREYNKFNDGWQCAVYAGIDAQTVFLNAQIAHFRKQPLAFNMLQYPHHREMRSSLKKLTSIKRVDIRQALEITEKQKIIKLKNGLDFEYAVYKLAFERLSDEDKARMNELYPDVETDHAYLDQEEIIANLLDDKGELSTKNKEKLAELVAGHCYNAFAKEYQLYHYFACIPLAEVARYFLIGKNIHINGKPLAQNQECDDDDSDTHDAIQAAVESYVKDHKITVEAILQASCLEWIDGDLFDQYTPLALSNDSELLERWFKAKVEARGELKKHITKGDLEVRDRSPNESTRGKLYSKRLYDAELEQARQALETIGLQAKRKGELDEKMAFAMFSAVITGESLYGFKSDWGFVRDFKHDVDTYNANLGLVYADNDPEHKGEHLDQELLIADTDKNGELNFFSMFGMATRRLDAFLKASIYFEEIEKDGETILAFNEKSLERIFNETKDDLVEGYATLLSFREIFKKLSVIYEIDLSYKIQEWLDVLEEHIDAHNEALNKATGQMSEKNKKLFIYNKPILKI